MIRSPSQCSGTTRSSASARRLETITSSLTCAQALACALPDTRLVCVADREADLMPLMSRAQQLGTPADRLGSAKHNRCLPKGDKLWAHTTEVQPMGEITFQMPARKDVKARPVRQHLWARRVALPAEKGAMVSAMCIVAREIGAPPDATPVEWCLLTNRTVANDLEAVALIDWYRARWEIEMLYDVLKNARRVEALQLGTIEKLERALALFMVVAWLIAYLMRSGRTCPDLDATLFFAPDEIHSAYLLNDQDAPDKPRLAEVLRMVARLGRFLGRKSDGEPDVKTICLGMEEVYVAAKTMGKLRDRTNAKNCV